jgi:hypothetical protein
MRTSIRHCASVIGLVLGLALLGACGEKKEEAPAPVEAAPPAPEASAAAAQAPAEAASAGGPTGAAPTRPRPSRDLPPPPPPPPASAIGGGPGADAADQVLAKLENANLAFRAPAQMRQDQSATVELHLSLRQEVAALERELAAAPTDRVEGAQVRVSRRVEALLTASRSDFEITPISATEQLLGSADDVSWSWEIKPLDGGTKSLHLTVNSILVVDGATTRRTVRSFDKEIRVEVSGLAVAQAFVAKNWQWLWATLLVPLAGWIWRRLRKAPPNAQA